MGMLSSPRPVRVRRLPGSWPRGWSCPASPAGSPPGHELTGLDLARYGTVAGAEEIRDTAVAQPLLVAAGLAAARALFGGLGQAAHMSAAAAGHSVGELAAGRARRRAQPGGAMRLVGVRGRAMASASAAEPTGMTAVLGGDQRDVLAALDACGLTPANVNGAGQIVAAGTMAQLAAFAAGPPAGARLRPLPVAGAFHTRHMAARGRARCAPRPPGCARPTRCCRCCPTPTARSCAPGRTGWSGS